MFLHTPLSLSLSHTHTHAPSLSLSLTLSRALSPSLAVSLALSLSLAASLSHTPACRFVNFRQDPRVDFSGWGLLEIPAETFEKSLVGRITKLNFNGTPSALEATQWQILSQFPTDATSSRRHLYGS